MKTIYFVSASFVLYFSLIQTGIAADSTTAPEFKYPAIKEHGGIAVLPNAAYPPINNSKVVVDVTSDSKSGSVLKALDRSALFLNLYEQAGHRKTLRYAIVLHGAATKASLKDDAYSLHSGPYDRSQKKITNPNLPLIRKLREAGVDIFVCGQALAHNGFSPEEVAPEITVAVSAGITVINLQNEGYAYLPFL